ncbi:MAG: type II toxin-antitoxin system VapC family toxin [Trueperaceae bacterium]|nr:type II toxin-antitoxin system VapC family toxin [Trueperaceae bacterium]
MIIDLPLIESRGLPTKTYISAITLAELSQGVHFARNDEQRSARLERLQYAESEYRNPLPFDAPAARTYGVLAGLVLQAGRSPRPRRLDLMIAAVAAVNGLPLFTRNAVDLVGIEARVKVVAV